MTVLLLPTADRVSAEAVTEADPAPEANGRNWPCVDVIVAFRNEAGLIAEKVRNLRRLDYPHSRLRFFMVDGGSSDRSESAARVAAAGDPRFRWLSCADGGKTRQINLAFARASAPWILLTDADARLPRDAVRRLVERGESDHRIGLVGSLCQPRRATKMDRTHWSAWNAVRRVENRFGCVTALGPCYLLRRASFGGWPDDVVADDVFASLEINRLGLRSELASVLVIERRAPPDAGSFLWHKVRKVRAVLVELLRFLPRAAEFRAAARAVCLCRVFGAFLGPLLVLACCAFLLARFPIESAFGAAVIASAFVIPKRARIARRATSPIRTLGLALTLSIVFVAAIVSLPFARPRTVFCRWKLEES